MIGDEGKDHHLILQKYCIYKTKFSLSLIIGIRNRPSVRCQHERGDESK